ncbi:MAG: MaoC family dehydratase [Alphaproteobacteria bacterium]
MDAVAGAYKADFNGYTIEDIVVGMTASFAKTITEADIVLFAGISGDTNPVHLSEAYAAKTMFKSRIAHGMLTAGLISAVLGTKLPGPGCIYISQELNFRAPVKPGDTVEAKVTVADVIPEKNRVTLHTACSVDGKVVLEGQAKLMLPSRAG